MGCNTLYLSSTENRNSGKKTANVHRKFTVRICVGMNDYLKSVKKELHFYIVAFTAMPLQKFLLTFLLDYVTIFTVKYWE